MRPRFVGADTPVRRCEDGKPQFVVGRCLRTGGVSAFSAVRRPAASLYVARRHTCQPLCLYVARWRTCRRPVVVPDADPVEIFREQLLNVAMMLHKGPKGRAFICDYLGICVRSAILVNLLEASTEGRGTAQYSAGSGQHQRLRPLSSVGRAFPW